MRKLKQASIYGNSKHISIIFHSHENDLKLDVTLGATAASATFLLQTENGKNLASCWKVEKSIKRTKCLMNTPCMKYFLKLSAI